MVAFKLCEVVNWIMGQWKDCVLIDGRSWSDGSGCSGSGPIIATDEIKKVKCVN